MQQVLIVDDNNTNLTLFRHLLKRLDDVEPITFDDPTAAIAWCEANEPDLVILDYMMPVMNGLQFIERFRSMPGKSDIPLVMVTADIESNVRHRALELGAHDFLTKPVENTEFMARARNLLMLRRSHVQLANREAWLREEVKKRTAEVVAREKEVVLRLSRAAEFRDPETGAHLLRMANYTRMIAEKLGLPENEQQLLLDAAPMHDIGKVGTPDSILLKPGRLTPEEFEIMKKHTVMGYEILRDSKSLVLRTAAVIAWTHHERYDGAGYPNGLKGEDIPLYGRIAAVADVFDALTSSRPYKPAWEMDRAREFLLESRGRHLDPGCVDAFLSDWSSVLAIHERYHDDELQNDIDLIK